MLEGKDFNMDLSFQNLGTLRPPVLIMVGFNAQLLFNTQIDVGKITNTNEITQNN